MKLQETSAISSTFFQDDATKRPVSVVVPYRCNYDRRWKNLITQVHYWAVKHNFTTAKFTSDTLQVFGSITSIDFYYLLEINAHKTDHGWIIKMYYHGADDESNVVIPDTKKHHYIRFAESDLYSHYVKSRKNTTKKLDEFFDECCEAFDNHLDSDNKIYEFTQE